MSLWLFLLFLFIANCAFGFHLRQSQIKNDPLAGMFLVLFGLIITAGAGTTLQLQYTINILIGLNFLWLFIPVALGLFCGAWLHYYLMNHP